MVAPNDASVRAGWICSGAIAGRTIATLAAQGPVDLVVVFGAIHTPVRVRQAALDSHQKWALPGGLADIPDALQRKLPERSALFIIEPRLHAQEHAVEVNVPLVQLAFPGAAVLPIEVPVDDNAAEIGRCTARLVRESSLKAVFLASSDFTHYGINYGFTPAGVGPAAMQWAKDNDKRLLELISRLAVQELIPEVRQHHNACGAGAIVAMLTACQEFGATKAEVLRHATSYETLAQVAPQPPNNAVGYAAVVAG
jgi:AmmeMemoRadiSam system protein B